ncbi:hypothetical protein HaLaN_00326, partial [Haematococcus lacustris]
MLASLCATLLANATTPFPGCKPGTSLSALVTSTRVALSLTLAMPANQTLAAACSRVEAGVVQQLQQVLGQGGALGAGVAAAGVGVTELGQSQCSPLVPSPPKQPPGAGGFGDGYRLPSPGEGDGASRLSPGALAGVIVGSILASILLLMLLAVLVLRSLKGPPANKGPMDLKSLYMQQQEAAAHHRQAGQQRLPLDTDGLQPGYAKPPKLGTRGFTMLVPPPYAAPAAEADEGSKARGRLGRLGTRLAVGLGIGKEGFTEAAGAAGAKLSGAKSFKHKAHAAATAAALAALTNEDRAALLAPPSGAPVRRHVFTP